MSDYRPLTSDEIETLCQNGCWAEDWTSVNVAEDFTPQQMHRVTLYGEVNIGRFDKYVEVSMSFAKHSGISNATLRNVTVGDDCLIENVGCCINNYTIGDDCLIANVGIMQTTEGATYGEGNMISVLNEAGDGNLIVFSGLTSQLAAFMVACAGDHAAKASLCRLIREDVQQRMPERGTLGNGVKIVNSKEITNCQIGDDCEVNGASRLSDCTLLSSPAGSVYVGMDVIVENSVVAEGASLTNGVNVQDCFVGEVCQLSNGFTASQSVFFANSVMSNGEACAAFCGPFSASHHKSSLLIGTQLSFYNAGSATNFSNHAYKMGPLHWGTLYRGSKTASGAHILLPATIGAFSVCLGKIENHPDSTMLPFSYLIGNGKTTTLIPGRNLTTVGLYRDVDKWPKRDLRPSEWRKSIIHYDWLSPATMRQVMSGKRVLEELLAAGGSSAPIYYYQGLAIPASSLKKGIAYYDMALSLYLGQAIETVEDPVAAPADAESGKGEWTDLSGMLLPQEETDRLASDLKEETLSDLPSLATRFEDMARRYEQWRWAWTYNLILQHYHTDIVTPLVVERIRTDYRRAYDQWQTAIKADAEKEYNMGDVEEAVLQQFVEKM